MKIDLHIHSEYSWDSKVTISSYIKMAEEMGIGAISITDHNSIESHQEIKKLQKMTSIILVPGQEINTLDGHLLIYGWIGLVPRDLSMSDTIVHAKKMGIEQDTKVVCIAAHPFDRFRSGGGATALESGVDGLEVLNASALFGSVNKKAARYAMGRDLISLGNSDCHRSSEFAFAYSEIDDCVSVDELFHALIRAKPKGKRIGSVRKIIRFVRRKAGIMTD